MATSTASRIAPGMRLRQRYLIREVQRQTPHVSTYLALDQERFNRPCILTEFPLQSDNDVTQERLLERFRQTAMPLFQLNHPQLPQFSAAFRHRQSLFLAQNHAEGVSYRQLLNLRHKLNRTLTEPEVLHLLLHLLPVLTELHQRDIIHCKISPDCILLPSKPPKSSDELHLLLQHEAPLLVGMGAVEQLGQTLATLQDGRNVRSLVVGQPGYAPPEQLQTGRLLPSSDLYALAVTSLVLLTGQEPQDLLDGQTLSWNWQPFVSLSQPFEAVLRRMLAWQPGDRYPSAKEALQDVHQAFHYINLHSTVAPEASKAFPIAVQKLTVDSLLPKSPSRALRSNVMGAVMANATVPGATTPSSATQSSTLQAVPDSASDAVHQSSSSLDGSMLDYHNLGKPAGQSAGKGHGKGQRKIRYSAQAATQRKYPANPNHRAPSVLEVGTVLGLSLSAIAATTTLFGVATVSPLDALSSDRSNWFQRVAEATVNWSELDWPEVKLSAPDVSEWSAKLPGLGQGKGVQDKGIQDKAERRGMTEGSQPPSLSTEKLDFDQPMLTSQRDAQADASVREEELLALKSGLDDIDIPIYFEPESNTQTLTGTLYELRNQSYMLVAEPGQELIVQLDAVDAELTVLDAWRRPINLDAELTQQWQGELPGGDRYFIQVVGKGEYRLNVQLWDPDQVIAPVSETPSEFTDEAMDEGLESPDSAAIDSVTAEVAVDPASIDLLEATFAESAEAYDFNRGGSFVESADDETVAE